MIEIALLGLGSGAIYGLLGQGLVTVYRGSGVINFSHGAFAMAAAYLFYDLRIRNDMGWLAAILITVFATFVLGVLVHLLVMRPMRQSTALAQIAATLGIFISLTAIARIRYGPTQLFVPQFLPNEPLTLPGGMIVIQDRLFIFAIGLAVTAILWATYRFTHFGRTTQTVAADRTIAALLGISPDRTAALNWGVGCALAGLAGCLLVGLTGVQLTTMSLLVIPALAAAAPGRFISFPMTFGCGLLLGIIEAEVARYVNAIGWGKAVPFIAIMILFAVRGLRLPGRGVVAARLPGVESDRSHRTVVLVLGGLLLVLINVLDSSWTRPLMVSAMAAILALSVVLLTGYAGQLSLATYALAGLGALITGHVMASWHWAFVPAAVFGVAATVVAGVVIALPATRARGVDLAIVTLGLGLGVQAVVFANPRLTGGFEGLEISDVALFGWSIDIVQHPERYASVVMVTLVLCTVAALNVRRSRTGRQMLAVRGNERVAAAMGIAITRAKLTAFGMSTAIAALGGIFIGFQTPNLSLESFTSFQSITLVAFVVLAGVGYASGAWISGLLAVGGLVSRFFLQVQEIDQYLALLGGLSLTFQLAVFPDGIAPGNMHLVRRARARLRSRTAGVDEAPAELAAEPVRAADRVLPRVLDLIDVGVTYGGVIAVQGVTMSVRPGRIIGLIGPNGAGKTTLIDAITGHAPSSGRISLDGIDLTGMPAHRRARLGIGRSFQSIELFPDLTVEENISVATESGSRALRDLVAPGRMQLSHSAIAAVDELELHTVLHDKPDALTFSMRHLVGIARAISAAPSILLLDEPCAGLDVHEVRELTTLVRRLAEDWGFGILLVEHHLDMIMAVCDEIVVLEAGLVIAHGTPADIQSNAVVRAVYTGTGTDAVDDVSASGDVELVAMATGNLGVT